MFGFSRKEKAQMAAWQAEELAEAGLCPSCRSKAVPTGSGEKKWSCGTLVTSEDVMYVTARCRNKKTHNRLDIIENKQTEILKILRKLT